MGLRRRVERLEQASPACRDCGGEHVPDVTTLLVLGHAGEPRMVCACAPCCSWVAELAAEVEP